MKRFVFMFIFLSIYISTAFSGEKHIDPEYEYICEEKPAKEIRIDQDYFPSKITSTLKIAGKKEASPSDIIYDGRSCDDVND